jgi:putative DNA primase/helicase
MFEKVFKTFVIGKGKRSIEAHKGKGHLHDWDEVIHEGSFGGILREDFIDISFDTKEEYDKFLDMADANEWRCLALPSSHGGHTYWRNSKIKKGGAEKKLACGLIADIHDKGTYIPLKVDGVDRFPADYDIVDGEDYQEVPNELLPVNTNISLLNLEEGDGRNSELFRYILIMQQQLNLSNDEIRAVLGNINRFVLKTPMSKDELETLSRDEAFEKPIFFTDKGVFIFDKFAEYLCSHLNVCKINHQLHIYKGGIYYAGYHDIEVEMIKLISNLKAGPRKEVLQYLELIAPERQPADARFIGFRNGVLDIITGEMQPFSPEVVITNQIPWDYVADAESPLAEHTLNKLACGDSDIRALLEECIGYCMYKRNELGKSFILTGDKSNGKSTYLTVLKTILGDANTSALDLSELGDRFSTAMLFNKLANIGDDIGDDFLSGNQVAIFKKIVTGERIKAERKGQDPFEFSPYVKLLFAANDIPRMKDKTGAVIRRLVIIPFNAKFSKLDPDYRPFIKYELQEQESIEYLIRVGIEGLKRVLINECFTESAAVKDQLSMYEEENNPIVGFLQDAEIINENTTDVYKQYQIYCSDNALTPLGKIVFIKQINKRLGTRVKVTTVNGKRFKIFAKDL